MRKRNFMNGVDNDNKKCYKEIERTKNQHDISADMNYEFL